jgi:hypothetical protein
MGVIEDVRKVIQDTVAPDLKALAVKVEELEKRMELKFQSVEQRFDDQRDYLDKRFDGIDKRFDGLERMLNQQQLINSLVERVRALETGVKASPVVHEESKMERAG